jgi:N-formylglutamate deformylase
MTAETGFEVVVPEAAGPIVVEVPHAGLMIDDVAASFTKIPPDALAKGALVADSDIGADLVWEGSEAHGVTRVTARASRYVIDLNTEPKLPTPYEEKKPVELRMARRYSQCGLRWSEEPLPKTEIERRIRELFEPYHLRVHAELERARARHDAVVLVGSHTFPDPKRGIADVVLGTRHGAAASTSIRDAVADAARAHGFSVALEAPFAGGYASVRHARPHEGVHVVQIEVAKRLVSRASDGGPWLEIDPEGAERVRAMLVDAEDALRCALALSGRGG